MAMQIQLIGSITIDGKPSKLGQNRLLQLLAVHHPKPVDRETLLAALWPDDESADARNRLRVALSRLRAEVPLTETESKSGGADLIGFDRNEVKVDLYEVHEKLSVSRIEPDPSVEQSLLKELAPLLSKKLCVPSDSEAFQQAHNDWALAASQGLSRLAGLAASEGDWDTSLAAAEGVLSLFPFDADAWESRIQAMVRLSRGQEAARLLSKAVKQDDTGQLAELQKELPRLLEGVEHRFTPGQSQLLAKVVERAFEVDHDLLTAFLASSVFRLEMIRAPADALPLLTQAQALDLPEGDLKERIEVRIITCLGLLNRDQEVVDEAERFLSGRIGHARRRIALLNQSYSLFKLGQVQRSLDAIDLAIRIAEETDSIFDAWQCKAQKGALLIHLDRLPEAISLLREAVEYFRQNPLDRDADQWVIQANYALALARSGDLRTAAPLIKEAVQKSTELEAMQLSMQKAIYGYIRILAGHLVLGAQLLQEAIRESYRIDHQQCMAIVGLAGEAMSKFPLSDDTTLMQWKELRRKQPYPLTPWEARILKNVRSSVKFNNELSDVARWAVKSLKLINQRGAS